MKPTGKFQLPDWYRLNTAQGAGVLVCLAIGAFSATALLPMPLRAYALLLLGPLVLAAVIDARHMILPDSLNALIALTGAAFVLTLPSSLWPHHALGAAFGFGGLVALEKAYAAWRGRDGLGRGDAKLLGALGVWVRWDNLPVLLLLAAASALVFALAAGHLKNPAKRLPFGPFLCLAGWCVLLGLDVERLRQAIALISGFSE